MTVDVNPDDYRQAWNGQAHKGYTRCADCGEMAYCCGSSAGRRRCLSCFAIRAARAARRIVRQARREARKAGVA